MCAGPSSCKHQQPALGEHGRAPRRTPRARPPAGSGRRSAGLPGSLGPLSGRCPPGLQHGPLGRTRPPPSVPPSDLRPRSPQAALALRRVRSEPQAGDAPSRQARWRPCEDLRRKPSQGSSGGRAGGQDAARGERGGSGGARVFPGLSGRGGVRPAVRPAVRGAPASAVAAQGAKPLRGKRSPGPSDRRVAGRRREEAPGRGALARRGAPWRRGGRAGAPSAGAVAPAALPRTSSSALRGRPPAGGAVDELAQPPSSGGSKGPVPALSPCPRAGLAALRRPTCPDGAGFLVLSSPGPWALGALRASAGGGGPGGGAPSPGTEAR